LAFLLLERQVRHNSSN